VVLSHISEELAVSAKVRVGRVTFVFLFLVAVVVATGIKVVGTLLVGALVILPAAAAKNVSTSLARYAFLSALLGTVSAVAGISAAPVTGLPPGPLVVLAGTFVFMGSLLAKYIMGIKRRVSAGTRLA
jgi:ABC-type Mn2+/Zn2+ transport system permease subunit